MQPNTICLLTGATGGIGQAIATLLDQQGVTLILHGRDSEKLANLKQRLLKNHHTITLTQLKKKMQMELVFFD